MRIALFALVVAASAQDWPSFRGPTASGVAEGTMQMGNSC
jgi:hypothetical protein